MKVFGLAGKSGSEKSYQAINLCREKGIDSILDDGLFISRNSILAGISAKRQETRVRAIKTALYSDDSHRDLVVSKIKEVDPASILVIGTSVKMIERIVGRLGLPQPEEIIHIEKITTSKQRKIADRERNELGKHVIPAPTFQLKKEFSGYFMHPLRIIRDIRGGSARDADRSVVRPTFSYLGKYIISNRALSDIAEIAGSVVPGVESVLKVSADNDNSGVDVWVSVYLRYGVKVIETAKETQKRIADSLEEMTAFNIRSVNVDVKGLR